MQTQNKVTSLLVTASARKQTGSVLTAANVICVVSNIIQEAYTKYESCWGLEKEDCSISDGTDKTLVFE